VTIRESNSGAGAAIGVIAAIHNAAAIGRQHERHHAHLRSQPLKTIPHFNY